MSPLVEDNKVKNFSRFLKFFLIEWSLAKWSKNKTWSKLEQWEQFLLKESQESLVTWKLLSNMNTQSYLNTQIILNDTDFFIGKESRYLFLRCHFRSVKNDGLPSWNSHAWKSLPLRFANLLRLKCSTWIKIFIKLNSTAFLINIQDP